MSWAILSLAYIIKGSKVKQPFTNITVIMKQVNIVLDPLREKCVIKGSFIGILERVREAQK